MNKTIIKTSDAPAAIGPYSQAVIAGDFVHCSGQIALDAATGELIEGDVEAQTQKVLDNLVHVAHNVQVGEATLLIAQVGIAGSSTIGRYCLIGGAAGVSGHIEVADRTTIAARSVVLRPITEPGLTWSGTVTAQPIRVWQKNLARLLKLDDLARQVRQLEKNPGESEKHD